MREAIAKFSTIASAAAAFSALTTSSAYAASVTNSGFETGNFTGWTTTGVTTVVGNEIGTSPVAGNFQALLSTAGTVSDSALETFLGLSSGSLDSLGNGNATAGSAIKQTITVTAGEVFSFSYNFLTNEATPSSFNDFGFFSVVNANQSLQELADTSSSFITSLTSFNEETGYQPGSFTFGNAGTYTIGFGVVDEGDSIVDSALLVDTEPVPTPALLPGLISMGVAAFRRRKDIATEEV